MLLRLFKPEFPIGDINVSKHLHPDNERVEDTDIFDSNIPTTDEVDQNENDNLDQDLNEGETSEKIVERQTVQNRSRQHNMSRPAPGRDFTCCGGIPQFTRGKGHGRATQH